MRAFSDAGPEPRGITAVSCPSCPGVLAVAEEGSQGFLVFRCRIGHAFSASELVRGKEERLEALQWANITARDELASLLRDLAAREGEPRRRAVLLERAESVQAHIATIRALLEQELPTEEPGRSR